MTPAAPQLEIVARAHDDDVLALLRTARRLISDHPRVARMIVSAFVAEGRAFARTPEGQQIQEQLLRSQRLRRARLVWDALGLGRFVEHPVTFLPSRWIGAVVAASASLGLEELLSKLHMPEVR